jgi:phage baseplate assembly protein V
MMTLLDTILAANQPTRESTPRTLGVSTAIVTDNNDEQGLGRVRVKFPWSDKPSGWAPIMTPMAGDGRGLYLMPEVDDQVLVLFDGGNIDAPFVIGSIWNGRSRPPIANDKKKSDLRLFKSRSGHTITLDDTSGKEQVSIVDKSGKNTIVIDSASNTITIHAGRDLSIESDGSISIGAAGTLNLKGKVVKINDDALEIV